MKKKSLAVNSIFNVMYRILNILFPLITTTYVARVLSVNIIGEITYAQNIAQYFILLAPLGIPKHGVREIAKVYGNEKAVNQRFSELFILNAISTTFCVIVYYSMIFINQNFKEYLPLFFLSGAPLILNYLNVDWVYQGYEEYSYITVRSTIVKVISLILIICFVKKPEDYLLYVFLSAIALAGNYIYNIFHLSSLNVKLQINDIDIKKHIGPVLSLFVTTIAIEIYTLMDTTMIGMMCEKDNITYYSYAMRISRSVVAVVAAIGGVLLPRLSFYRENNEIEKCNDIVNKVLEILFYLMIPCVLGIMMTSEKVIYLLYGINFSECIPILKISSLLVIAIGLNNLFGTQILLTFGNENQLFVATVIGAISNILLNMFLIPSWQGIGAVTASVTSEVLVAIITGYYASKCIKFKLKIRNFITSLMACGLMYIISRVIEIFIHNTLICLIGTIILGVMTYIFGTYCLKNNVSGMLVIQMKKIFR